jgi:hypothetical protein
MPVVAANGASIGDVAHKLPLSEDKVSNYLCTAIKKVEAQPRRGGPPHGAERLIVAGPCGRRGDAVLL